VNHDILNLPQISSVTIVLVTYAVYFRNTHWFQVSSISGSY